MKNDYWSIFANSGKIDDYLKYKENENSDSEFSKIVVLNANNNQGYNNQGTNDRRER